MFSGFIFVIFSGICRLKINDVLVLSFDIPNGLIFLVLFFFLEFTGRIGRDDEVLDSFVVFFLVGTKLEIFWNRRILSLG